MFGYIIANQSDCTPEQWRRYHSCYCGLCRTIGRQCGQLSRVCLSYDFTFLALLLSSLYEPEETHTCFRCPAHPCKRRTAWSNPIFDYCADMNVLLAYENCLDDWRDDHRLRKLFQACLLHAASKKAARRHPRQSLAVRQCLHSLSKLEKEGCQTPDLPANVFAELLGELFVWRETDYWADSLRRLGESLGRFIYVMDAVLDLDEDRKRGRYNPFSSAEPDAYDQESFRGVLLMLIGEASTEFEKLPLVQDTDLMRAILYAGVWSRYHQSIQKKQAKEDSQ